MWMKSELAMSIFYFFYELLLFAYFVSSSDGGTIEDKTPTNGAVTNPHVHRSLLDSVVVLVARQKTVKEREKEKWYLIYIYI